MMNELDIEIVCSASLKIIRDDVVKLLKCDLVGMKGMQDQDILDFLDCSCVRAKMDRFNRNIMSYMANIRE